MMSIIDDERVKEMENKHEGTRQARNVYKNPQGKRSKRQGATVKRERGVDYSENG
jgi:hypothetical protein